MPLTLAAIGIVLLVVVAILSFTQPLPVEQDDDAAALAQQRQSLLTLGGALVGAGLTLGLTLAAWNANEVNADLRNIAIAEQEARRPLPTVSVESWHECGTTVDTDGTAFDYPGAISFRVANEGATPFEIHTVNVTADVVEFTRDPETGAPEGIAGVHAQGPWPIPVDALERSEGNGLVVGADKDAMFTYTDEVFGDGDDIAGISVEVSDERGNRATGHKARGRR